MGRNHAPLKGGGRPKSLACQSGMVARVWVTRCGPRSHVVDRRGALATAPLPYDPVKSGTGAVTQP